MCLAHGHNAVTLVRLEPVTSLSPVKHSTTIHKRIIWLKDIIFKKEKVCKQQTGMQYQQTWKE